MEERAEDRSREEQAIARGTIAPVDEPQVEAGALPGAHRWLAIALPWWASDLARRRIARRQLTEMSLPGAGVCPRVSVPRETPLLIHRTHRNAKEVVALCPHAHTAGARPEMPLAEAKALCGERAVEIEWTPLADAQSLRRLARWCTRYAPLVMPRMSGMFGLDGVDGIAGIAGMEGSSSMKSMPMPPSIAHATPCVIVDVTGCEKVHGGDATLAARVLRDLHRRSVHAQVAIASTQRAALAASAAWPCRVLPTDPRQAADMLADLPLWTLRLAPATLESLREVNVRRIGEACALPRRGSADRFGSELFAALDELRGERPERFEPLPHQRPIEVDLPFDGPTTRLEAVELAVTTALERFCARLGRRGRGVRLMELSLRRVNELPVVERLTLGGASRQPRHLWTLLRPRLERVNMGFGVEGVVLRSLIDAPLSMEQRQWCTSGEPDEHAREGDAETERQVSEMLDQVAARLGSASVRGAKESIFSTCVRPTVIFPKPLAAEVVADQAPVSAAPGARRPIEVRWPGGGGRVREADGPERHSPRWWTAPTRAMRGAEHREGDDDAITDDRDFWRVRTADGRWLWLLHRRPDRWVVIGAWA